MKYSPYMAHDFFDNSCGPNTDYNFYFRTLIFRVIKYTWSEYIL